MDERLDAIKLVSGSETDEEKLEYAFTKIIYKIANVLRARYTQQMESNSYFSAILINTVPNGWERRVIKIIACLIEGTYNSTTHDTISCGERLSIHFENNKEAPRVDLTFYGQTVSLVGDKQCYDNMSSLVTDKLEAIIDKHHTAVERDLIVTEVQQVFSE